MLMIDWLTLEIPYIHTPIPSGVVQSITSDGEIDWITEKRTSVRGSHESNLLVRSTGAADFSDSEVGQAAFLQVDGNLVKFLQGHNVVGTDDIIMLVDMAISKLFFALGRVYSSDLRAVIFSGDFKVSRIDVTGYIQFNSENDAMAWQMAAESCATSRQGKFTRKGTTIYMGKNSRRVALKIYSKYLELTQAKKGHKLPFTLPYKQQLLKYVESKLRMEVVCRGLFLKDLGLNKASALTPEILAELYAKQVGKIEMNAQVKLQPYEEFDLPRAVLSTYMLWKDGSRLVDILPTNTFYRHRRVLLKQGIDIKVSPKKLSSNVVPLIRMIEAKPCAMPQWSESAGLIFN